LEDMKGLIEYDGKVENYLNKLIAVSTKKQGEILETMRDECEQIIEKYWYTFLLSELIIVSFQEHHRENMDHYQIVIQKWMGIWTRFQETLNLLRDSMILGLQGRTVSATILLRPVLESITSGVFYHFLAQEEYRKKASVVESLEIGRGNDVFSGLVEEVINEIEDKLDVPFYLEAMVTKKSLDSKPPLGVPKFKSMLKQISDWGVIDNPQEEIMELLNNRMFGSLSSFSHSLHEGTYIRGAMLSKNINILLGWELDFESFKEYSRGFGSLCYIVLVFYLNSTEELQKTESFSRIFEKFLEINPKANTVLESIVEQIKENIHKWKSQVG
jgi:hypothetical protein